jgi:hypothetical protein
MTPPSIIHILLIFTQPSDEKTRKSEFYPQ